MTYPEWYHLMNKSGWHQRAILTKDKETIIIWRHESVTLADGTPIMVDEDCAELHWRAGTTPPPF